MSLSGEMFLETSCAEVLRSGAHAHIAQTGIVGDEQEPYFHFASKKEEYRARVCRRNEGSSRGRPLALSAVSSAEPEANKGVRDRSETAMPLPVRRVPRRKLSIRGRRI